MQNQLKNKIKEWFRSLKEKYHLSIVNKDSFEQVYSLRVSKGLFIFVVFGLICLIFLISLATISFTPIKRIVPGFESDEMHQSLVSMQQRLAFLEKEIEGKLSYGAHLDTVIAEVDSTLFNPIASLPNTSSSSNTTLKSTVSLPVPLHNYHFYKPVSGIVSQAFKLKNKHFGIDIVCKKNEAVKATLGGKVLLAAWTIEEGNIIAIQHQDNLVSFYKHNSALLKRRGDLVKAGEIIAIVGNSGELTTGPHLHFEIWQNGTPLNPSDLINFE